MYKYLLFDLDGTLTDPALGITNSIMYALRELGREVPPREELYKFIGPPLVPAFMEFIGMDEEEAREALRLYRVYFKDKGLFENSPYSGIADVLGRLKGTGRRLYVTTSKPEVYAERILEHFELDGYFEAICGASMDEKRVTKDDMIRYTLDRAGNPSPEDVLMIGDRHHDIDGAHTVGTKAAGVLWGYGSEEELTGCGADMIFSSLDELEKNV